MCFSATASFSAGIALLACGVASIYRARNHNRLKMIADIPLIFGIQQLAEGFVWLSFINPTFAPIRMITTYLFLGIAGVVWPLWIPASIMKYEQTGKYFLSSLFAGIFFAIGFIAYAIMYPISVSAPCSIAYSLEVAPWAQGISTFLYIMATIVPFFFSRNKMLWLIGGLIAASYVISYIFYIEAFASVWCFFAAIISLLVYGFIANETQRPG